MDDFGLCPQEPNHSFNSRGRLAERLSWILIFAKLVTKIPVNVGATKRQHRTKQ
jgi:hypothetical protein